MNPSLRQLWRRGLAALGNAPERADAAPARPTPATPPARPAAAAGSAVELKDWSFSFEYSPSRDGDPDPGEIVWTWIPYEDDPTQGKDRPVLVLARLGSDVVVAQLTSKDHDRDAADEARYGRYWMDIGSGDWDERRRPSEVRLDRLLRVDPARVRREGGVLDAQVFRQVVAALQEVRARGL